MLNVGVVRRKQGIKVIPSGDKSDKSVAVLLSKQQVFTFWSHRGVIFSKNLFPFQKALAREPKFKAQGIFFSS